MRIAVTQDHDGEHAWLTGGAETETDIKKMIGEEDKLLAIIPMSSTSGGEALGALAGVCLEQPDSIGQALDMLLASILDIGIKIGMERGAKSITNVVLVENKMCEWLKFPHIIGPMTLDKAEEWADKFCKASRVGHAMIVGSDVPDPVKLARERDVKIGKILTLG